jgi:hypothetical protein
MPAMRVLQLRQRSRPLQFFWQHVICYAKGVPVPDGQRRAMAQYAVNSAVDDAYEDRLLSHQGAPFASTPLGFVSGTNGLL